MFLCKICDEALKTSKALRFHVRTVHPICCITCWKHCTGRTFRAIHEKWCVDKTEEELTEQERKERKKDLEESREKWFKRFQPRAPRGSRKKEDESSQVSKEEDGSPQVSKEEEGPRVRLERRAKIKQEPIYVESEEEEEEVVIKKPKKESKKQMKERIAAMRRLEKEAKKERKRLEKESRQDQTITQDCYRSEEVRIKQAAFFEQFCHLSSPIEKPIVVPPPPVSKAKRTDVPLGPVIISDAVSRVMEMTARDGAPSKEPARSVVPAPVAPQDVSPDNQILSDGPPRAPPHEISFCVACETEFDNPVWLMKHQTGKVNHRKNYICTICHACTNVECHFFHHLLGHCPPDSVLRNALKFAPVLVPPETERPSTPYDRQFSRISCGICGLIFGHNIKVFIQHVEKEHNEEALIFPKAVTSIDTIPLPRHFEKEGCAVAPSISLPHIGPDDVTEPYQDGNAGHYEYTDQHNIDDACDDDFDEDAFVGVKVELVEEEDFEENSLEQDVGNSMLDGVEENGAVLDYPAEDAVNPLDVDEVFIKEEKPDIG